MSEDQQNSGLGNQGGAAGREIIVDDQILGEHADNPALESFKGRPIRDLLKSYDNANRFLADKAVLPKGKNDTPENWEAVFDKLGRPKDATGYAFQKPDLPPGMRYDAGLERAFAAKCHELGVLPKQAQGLFQFYQNQVIEAADAWLQERDQAYGKGHEELVRRFGSGTVDRVLKIANDTLCRFGGTPAEVQYIVENYGNDPDLIALLYRIGSSNFEDALVKGERIDPFDGKGSAEALKKAILYDKNHPLNEAYTDKRHPRHKEAVDAVTHLNTLLVGNRTLAKNEEVEW